MRYITDQHPDQPGIWCLCEDGEVLEVLPDGQRSDAVVLLASSYDWMETITAAGDLALTWEADPGIAYEDVVTSDRRLIEPGALSHRDLPLPLMWQTETSHGHQGAAIAGAIDQVERRDSGVIFAAGRFDSGTVGREAARLVGEDVMRGVSIDLGSYEATTEVLSVDDAGAVTDWLDRFSAAELIGATGTPFPAFEKARIRPRTTVGYDLEEMTAAAGPLEPPAEWFADPGLTEPTPITITDDGRVFGHLALWGTCHIGRADACITPPKSAARYSYFATGLVRCGDGCEIPVGVITFNTGHADLGSNHREAASHYDHTGTAGMRVAIHEDRFGPIVAGALCPGLSDEQIAVLRSATLSGDWRRIGGNLELVAILAVNVPGFPVPRTQARVASGEQLALVAAASPQAVDPILHRITDLELRMDRTERITSALRNVAASELDVRLGDFRDVSTQTRKQAAKTGAAMPDGSYPILNETDLKAAIQSYGRAKNKAAVKAHIMKRARALGLAKLLPADWKA